MKTIHFLLAACVAAAGLTATSADASVLLNGATDTREAAFPSFLDDTRLNTRAWAFPKSSDHTLLTGGELSSVVVEAVGATGGAGITISNSENGGVPRTADLNGYSWNYGYSGSDIGERNELANDGGGIWSLNGTLTINVPTSIVPTMALTRVELLAVAGLAGVRTMDVSANGTPYVADWDLRADLANHWNSVLEFEVIGNPTGLTMEVSPGSFGDVNPYIHALGVTVLAVIPEPSTFLIWSLLAALGIGLGAYRRKR
jgi:hypothetical protein